MRKSKGWVNTVRERKVTKIDKLRVKRGKAVNPDNISPANSPRFVMKKGKVKHGPERVAGRANRCTVAEELKL